jgi:two-component system, LytTR family, response regulator
VGRIQTVVVDDERIARQRLRRLLSTQPDFELVGECSSGEDARSLLEEREVDLLFLDVQMAEMNGFRLLDTIPPDRRPLVVFVTAHSEHALQAFEADALDYLLKPFDRERFNKCLQRAREQLTPRRQDEDKVPVDALRRVIESLKPKQERFAIRTNGRVVFVRAEEIDWVEAADNYVCLHVGPDTHILRETMNALEARLDPDHFVRVHRSKMVNVDRIKELQPWFHGEYVIVLQDGTNVTLSRGYRERLMGLLKA